MRVIDRTRLTSIPFSLIILNGVHFPPLSLIQMLAQHAKEIIAADGAANYCL
jgi:thiamine pyrophosphokinase